MPPWDKYRSPAPAGGDPYVIPSDPRRSAEAAAEEARRAAAEARAQRAAAISAASAGISADKAARDALEWNATHNPDGSPKPNAANPVKATEDENKSSAFYKRASRSLGTYDKIGLGPRSAVGQGIAENLWGGEGLLRGLPDSIGDSPDRQVTEQAKRDFVTAILRSDSGANAPEPEVERMINTYFPRPNETDPKVLENYAAARQTALEALRARAGILAKDLPAYVRQKPEDADKDADGLSYANSPENAAAGTVSDYGGGGKGGPGGGNDPGFWGIPDADQLKRGLGIGAGNVIQGVGDIAGIFGNPLNATINAATGSNLSTDMGRTLRDDVFGLPRGTRPMDQSIEALTRGGTAALTGAGLAGGARALAQGATSRGALDVLAANPMRQLAAGASGGLSGDMARQSGAGMGGQIAASILGGAAGYGGASLAARAPRTPSPVMAAANRQNIKLLPADVGGTGTRMASGVLAKTLGGIPMAQGAEASLASASAARNAAAARIGGVMDETGAGQAAQRGARSFVKSSAERESQLYERIPVPPKSLAQSANTRTALAEITQGMESNPALSKLWTGHPQLRATLDALSPQQTAADQHLAVTTAAQRLTAASQAAEEAGRQGTVLAGNPKASALAQQELSAAKSAYNDAVQAAKIPPKDGTVSWEDMKRLRTIVGQIVGKPGLASDGATDAAMRKFYGALSTDMEATATASGPRALSEFRRATQFSRGRHDRIENVLNGILGNDLNKGEAAAFEQINRWAQKQGGDFKQLSRAMRSLPPDEASTVRASILGRMGTASKGQQNAEGTQFSPTVFASQWAGLSGRAKSVLFPDMTHRKSIDDIALVMNNMKRAGEYTNYSNTSLGGNATAHGIGALTIPIATASIAAAEFGLGAIMASPKMARWLATVPENPQAMSGHIARLGVIAKQDASIAGDARQLQATLEQAFGQSPTRAAATEDERNRRRIPPR